MHEDFEHDYLILLFDVKSRMSLFVLCLRMSQKLN